MARREFPGRKLETDYSRVMGEFYTWINTQYIKEFRRFYRQEEKLRNNAVFSTDILRKIREKILSSDFFDRVISIMETVLPNVEKRVVKDLTKVYKKRKFPIPEMYFKDTSESLKEKIAENVDLIRSFTVEHIERMENSVRQAVVSGGEDFDKLVIEIEKQANKGRAYAEFVASDQVAKAYADISEEKQRQVGIEKYEWVATSDSRTRKSHAVHDGKIYRWDEPPLLDFSLDGQTNRAPENLHPGEDYQCRCIAVPFFD